MHLVTNSETYANNKTFTWTLEEYSTNGIKIKLDFDQPEYITVDSIDIMQVHLTNTDLLMQPVDKKLRPIVDDYMIQKAIPNQQALILDQQTAANVTFWSQLFVIANIILSIFITSAMQLLFGTIIILQILAHFPLIEIVLPSNVM